MAAIRDQLDEARDRITEEPEVAERLARRVEGLALESGDERARVLALALRGTSALHRGELPVAHRVAALVETSGPRPDDAAVEVEVLAFRAQLAFFTGGYRDALGHAHAAIAIADAAGDPAMRLHARRRAAVILAALDEPTWPQRLHQLLELALATQDHWELAHAHVDLADLALSSGDVAGALGELAQGRQVAGRVEGPTAFLRGLLCCKHAEARLAAGEHQQAIGHAVSAQGWVEAMPSPNPHLRGTVLLVHVRALLAGDREDDAHRTAREGLARLGDTSPQSRATLLRELAGALRAAGRLDEAYDTLSDAADLERVAFRQFTEMRLDVERAIAAGTAARREAEALREAAERDPLTGLHNRRHLSRVVAAVRPGRPVAVAAVDLDHFKSVNDRYGHEVGDKVLVRAAQLLRATARASDVVARVGGEEFVVLMPGAAIGPARTLAERLRAIVAAEPWDLIAEDLTLTTSIGVVSAAEDVEQLLAEADRRLYAAKHAGRNRVVAEHPGSS